MSDILTDVTDGVLTITFNRPDKKNSITRAMYASMADALAQAVEQDAIRVVVFQGHEAIYSAGNDIADFLERPPATADSPVYRFLFGIASFPKPIIAAVCGPAVGIGTTMLMHCDLVYAGDNAAFSLPFVIKKVMELVEMFGNAKEDELAADHTALELVAFAGYDPTEYEKLLTSLGNQGGGFSNHPSTTDRVAGLKTAREGEELKAFMTGTAKPDVAKRFAVLK